MADLFSNQVLAAALLGWFFGQFLKVPFEYLVKRRWNWALWFSSGGMPSSHSSLMVSTTLAIGLYHGFGTPLFALAFAISMVVIYDATGVRRQAGFHAQKINILVDELFHGRPIPQERLIEVLGHTPRQVLGGMALGVVIALSLYVFWPPVPSP
ncbi:MAG: divergent PAP2 family protein [Bellilinea sp.]